MMKKENWQSYVMKVKELIEPVLARMETIDSKISQGKVLRPEYGSRAKLGEECQNKIRNL